MACILLIAVGFLNFFIQSKEFEIFVSAMGCLLFGFYLIYDTQLVVGKHKNALSTDDYIQGALQIYIDVVRIFLEILRILAIAKNKN